MKTLYNIKLAFACGLLTTFGVSCMSEDPFNNDSEGTSLVKMNLHLNETLTRSNSEDLNNNCRFYISNENGVLHKWIGLHNIPANGIYLRYGNYLAQAWAGDSVAASFDTKYYKGETRFEVSEKQISTNVIVNCKIANVVVSVDADDLSEAVRKSVKVNIGSTTGELDFSETNLADKGYFMRNYNAETETYDNILKYKIEVTDIDGLKVEREGEISDVKPAHEYKISLKNTQGDINSGGAAIQIQIREFELEVDETVIIHNKPEFAWENQEIEPGALLYDKTNTFTDKTLFIGAFNKFSTLVLSTDNEDLKRDFGSNRIDFIDSSAEIKEALKNKGLIIEAGNSGVYQQYRLTLKSGWLNSLAPSAKQYIMTVTAVDDRGMSNSMRIRIANMEEALDAPFAIDTEYWATNLLSIRAYSAEVAFNLYNKEIENLKFQYKKSDSDIWNESNGVSSQTLGGNKFKLSELDPETEYECRIVGGELSGESYKYESDIVKFKTEGVFEIPNASMENWWLYNKKIWIPGLDSTNEYWDSGNHGATLIGDENDNLTTQFDGMYHSGSSCARLLSKFVGVSIVGKLGSGNIFTGKYAGTSGTNGKIDFGRPYNASHPSKVRVWVNYRPAKAVSGKGAKTGYIEAGQLDKGQIYIAISDAIKKVDTSDSSTLVTQEKAPDLFLAYGQYTFEEDFGDENELKMVEIPFEYFEKAKTVAPKYLIIVCCASKYGDYFSGGDGSLMYVDDFELVYE